MDEDIPLPFDLPAVAPKKVSAAFDGGRITSDGGMMLLAQAERRLAIADPSLGQSPTSRMRTGSSIFCPISCARASWLGAHGVPPARIVIGDPMPEMG
jgi:hypothetical protein